MKTNITFSIKLDESDNPYIELSYIKGSDSIEDVKLINLLSEAKRIKVVNLGVDKDSEGKEVQTIILKK